MPWGQQDFRRFIPPLTWQCRPQVRRVVADQPPGAVVVDLGAGGRRIAPQVITVDFLPVPGVDLVADVSRLPFADGSVDLAIATGVIEHLADERAFMAEIARIVRKGGIVHLEVPFLQQYHEDPIDCRRLYRLRVGPNGGPPWFHVHEERGAHRSHGRRADHAGPLRRDLLRGPHPGQQASRQRRLLRSFGRPLSAQVPGLLCREEEECPSNRLRGVLYREKSATVARTTGV